MNVVFLFEFFGFVNRKPKKNNKTFPWTMVAFIHEMHFKSHQRTSIETILLSLSNFSMTISSTENKIYSISFLNIF